MKDVSMNIENFELSKTLETAIQNYLNGVELTSVELQSSLDFTIKISGTTWDGEFIDARIAAYVLKIQNIVRQIVTSKLQKRVNEQETPLIRVKLSKGSVNILVKIVEFFKPYLDKMTPTQQFIVVILTIGCLGGYWIEDRYLTHLLAIQNSQINERSDIRKDEFIAEAMDIAKTASEANKVLISKLRDGDEISFSSINKSFTAKEARKFFPKKVKSDLLTGEADAVCKIASIDLKHDAIVLLIGDDELKAHTKLSIEDRRRFYDEIKEAQKRKGELPEFSVNIDILYNEYGIKTATIVGFGEPRANSKRLAFFKEGKNK